MKTTRKFIIILCSVLLAFFLITLAFCVSNEFKYYTNDILIAQFIIFSLAACSVIIFCTIPSYRKVRGSTQRVTRIVLLSESNSLVDEFSLVGRTSGLIGKGETICFWTTSSDSLADECAVVNCVENYWYVERVSDERSVGLKRAGEPYIYKLKTGMCYRLHINDVLYVENERLLVL